MTRTLVLPGYQGSGASHWQRHWVADHAHSAIVEQPDWDRPVLSVWLERLEAELAKTENVLLVAHSLGCLLAANFADHPLSSRVSGALLVAPCDLGRAESLHPGAIHFGTMPQKRLPFPSLVVASLDDPYISIDQARLSADLWGSDMLDIGHAGHINIASGFGRWPSGYAFAQSLEQRQPAVGVASLRQTYLKKRGVKQPKAKTRTRNDPDSHPF